MTLIVCAALAMALFVAGTWIASWRTADAMVVSMLRAEQDVLDALDDLDRDCWWVDR